MSVTNPGIRALVDAALLPDASSQDRVIRTAHRWYEHLISLWVPGLIEASFDLGIFTPLADGPRTSGDLAAEIGCDPRAIRVMLDGLYSYDLIERTVPQDGTALYSLPAEARDCLLPDGLFSLAGKIGYDRRMAWDAWRNLAENVRARSGDQAGSEQQNQISEREYEMLVRGINFWAPPIVDILARQLVDHPRDGDRPSRMLDVGCGTGIYSQLLLDRLTDWTATGYDVSRILSIATTQSERLGVHDRFKPVVKDFQNEEWDSGFDLIFFANIFHLQTTESARHLMAKARKALADDGLIAIVDHIVDDGGGADSVQNRFFRLFATSMLATGGGNAYTVEDYDSWLRDNGLVRAALIDGPMHRILLAAAA